MQGITDYEYNPFDLTGGDRLPPQNIEAEEEILGGILLDPEAIIRVAEVLIPEAFYISAHQDIYRAALQLHSQGQPTDLMTICARLADIDRLEKVGGTAAIRRLLEQTVSSVNIDQYARLVAEKYTRRQLLKASTAIAQLAYDSGLPLAQVMDAAEQKIFEITQERVQRSLIPASEILLNIFSDLENKFQGGSDLPGIPTRFFDLDTLTQGLQRSDLIIIAGRPSMGKCLSKDAEILLEDGSLQTIEQLYAHQAHASSPPRLLTLGSDWHLRLTHPVAFIDDGLKPVFRVTTGTGRTIQTTLTHPFRVLQGWIPLSDLKVGDKIAVPRRLPVFGKSELTVGQLEHALEQTHKKDSIPDPIFRLVPHQLALFLNRLFATDGWGSVLQSGQAQIGFCTVSEVLARQVQHLLLRFGIVARLRSRAVAYRGSRRPAWQLDITDAPSLQTFVDTIGIFGKEEALNRIQLALQNRRYQTNCDLIPLEIWQALKEAKGTRSWQSVGVAGGIPSPSNLHVGYRSPTRNRLLALAKGLEDPQIQALATSDIYWDKIVSIEPQGIQQVYDLTISETHNFVANDICVHNTSFAVNMARNVAAHAQLPVAVFSLEMSREQLVQRMLSSEARIESNRLRSGRINDQEWQRLSQAFGFLAQAPIYIDDTANATVTELRSKARRLQAETGGALGMVLIDYLQLMQGSVSDNRVQELSRITRGLKGLAKELMAPVVVLSQLSRAVESRSDKRPQLSDLRESGCLAANTHLVDVDSGKAWTLEQLANLGDAKELPRLLSLNARGRLVPQRPVKVFSSGSKPVYTLQTLLNHSIQATGNHPFYTRQGWKPLDDLQLDEEIAIEENSELIWDPVTAISEPGDPVVVYDIEMPRHHNFVANRIVVHNSIEQDADIVMMLYRPEYYDPNTNERGIAEIIIAKHRNGPTGTVKLLFENQFTQFRNLADSNR